MSSIVLCMGGYGDKTPDSMDSVDSMDWREVCKEADDMMTDRVTNKGKEDIKF